MSNGQPIVGVEGLEDASFFLGPVLQLVPLKFTLITTLLSLREGLMNQRGNLVVQVEEEARIFQTIVTCYYRFTKTLLIDIHRLLAKEPSHLSLV